MRHLSVHSRILFFLPKKRKLFQHTVHVRSYNDEMSASMCRSSFAKCVTDLGLVDADSVLSFIQKRSIFESISPNFRHRNLSKPRTVGSCS